MKPLPKAPFGKQDSKQGSEKGPIRSDPKQALTDAVKSRTSKPSFEGTALVGTKIGSPRYA